MNRKATAKIIIAVLIIVLGAVVAYLGGTGELVDFDVYYTSHETYGGDAYTGIQNAAANTANNVNRLGLFMSNTVEYMFLFGGILIALLGAYMLCASIPDKRKVEVKASPYTTVATDNN